MKSTDVLFSAGGLGINSFQIKKKEVVMNSPNVGPSTGDDTRQIQNAIDSRGEVVLTPGEKYKSGTLELRSNITLNLNGATIETINDLSQFHKVGSSIRPVFIGAKEGSRNVKIVGSGNREHNVIKRATSFPLPVIHIDGTNGILIRGIFVDSRKSPVGTNNKPNGGFHINTGDNASNITIEDVMIKGNIKEGNVGTDGIHIQSSKNIKIWNWILMFGMMALQLVLTGLVNQLIII